MGGGGDGEVKAVATHSNSYTVHFGFSWSGGGNYSGVGYFEPMRDILFFYKEDGVGTSCHAVTNALG